MLGVRQREIRGKEIPTEATTPVESFFVIPVLFHLGNSNTVEVAQVASVDAPHGLNKRLPDDGCRLVPPGHVRINLYRSAKEFFIYAIPNEYVAPHSQQQQRNYVNHIVDNAIEEIPRPRDCSGVKGDKIRETEKTL